ncbi:MAG TPA: cobyrinate a,c-diamide synthase [Bryobacteraceae bacterium]
MPGFSSFLIAAPHSGAGKTTVTLGLLRALQDRGQRTQPFKCGPDFIDPIHHTNAAGRPSINLDLYMMSPDHIRDLYKRYTADADVAITEGVMGLFDGAQKREGSSADMAALLQLPVILILNAKALAYSAAALLYGLKHFDPALRIAGVIFNFVETATHYQLLKEACTDAGIPALGHLPTNKDLHIPSRHLGLDTAESGDAIAAAARHIGKHLDLDAILSLTASPPPDARKPSAAQSPSPVPKTSNPPARGDKTILVARDAAFHFLYPENLRRLGNFGRLHFFSPLNDIHLPTGDLLYLPGGYPELYLEQLSNNKTLLEDIRGFADKGRILAECGGMMFLGRHIVDESGKCWPVTGLLDIETGLQAQKLSLGYRTLTIDGQALKGHEFHYSQFVHDPAPASAAKIIVTGARGQEVPAPVFYRQNVFASYMHFYWGESSGPLESWLASAV